MYRLLSIALLGLILNACAAYTATSGRVVLQDDSKPADIHFNYSDRGLIADYYQKFPARKPVTENVKLVKGNALPAAVQSEPLPPELEQKLSSLPYSHARLRVGPHVVLIEKKTRIIADVFYAVTK